MYDFEYWCSEILHLEINWHHKEIIDALLNHKLSLIMASRGHGKTELVIAFVLWNAYYHKNKEYMIISASLGQAFRVLERIKFYIDTIPELKVLRPKFVGGLNWEDWKETWSKQEIRTSTNCKIMCRPFSSSVRGNHVDIAILDDVLRNEGSNRLPNDMVKKIFTEDVRPIINVKNGRMYVIGTPIDEDDLLWTIKTEIPEYYCVEIKAVQMDDNGKWIKATWESRFSLKDEEGKINLYKLRSEMNRLSPFSFEKEYLLVPIGQSNCIFDMEKVKEQIKDFNIKQGDPNKFYYCGVDIALSKSNKSDYTVITILEEDVDNNTVNCILQDRFSGLSQTEILKRIQKWHERFDFVAIYIEQNGLSYGMIRIANEDDFFDNTPNLIKGLVEGFKTTQSSKERIIGQINEAINMGTLYLPNNEILLNEMSGFGLVKKKNGKYRLEGIKVHDDTVMSLAIAYECYLETRGSEITVTYID